MFDEKMQNAFAITCYLFHTHADNPIDYVVWGYRKKPKGVPENHSGDVFIMHKNGEITGVSLKAGKEKSMEPKLNTYVGTTLRQPYYKALDSQAENKLKRRLWKEVYSKIKVPKTVNENNYYMQSNDRTKPNPDMVSSLVAFFKRDFNKFDQGYGVMNKVCREEVAKMVNKNVGNLMSNKYFLYFVLFLAITSLLGYLQKHNFKAIVFFILVGFLTYYFCKNMYIVLIIVCVCY